MRQKPLQQLGLHTRTPLVRGWAVIVLGQTQRPRRNKAQIDRKGMSRVNLENGLAL